MAFFMGFFMSFFVAFSMAVTHQQVFGLEVAVDDVARVQVEEGAAQVLHHVGRVDLAELHALGDGVEQVTALKHNTRHS